MMVNLLRNCLPPIPQKVAERQKRAGPQQCSEVSEQREDLRLHIRHARGIGRQMAHAWNEVAEGQAPVAHALEEAMRLGQAFLRQMDVLAEAVNERQAESAAENVAHGDAAHRAQQYGREGRHQFQMMRVRSG